MARRMKRILIHWIMYCAFISIYIIFENIFSVYLQPGCSMHVIFLSQAILNKSNVKHGKENGKDFHTLNHVLCVEIYWTYSWYLKSLLLFSTYVSYGLKVFWFPFYRILLQSTRNAYNYQMQPFMLVSMLFFLLLSSHFSSWFTHQQTHN